MSKKLPNYLRTYRRHSALSQREMAFLLGSRRGSKVSRHEQSARVPSIEALLGYEVVLGVPLRMLFAGIYEKVEAVVRERAKALIAELLTEPHSELRARKIQLLRRLLVNVDDDLYEFDR